MLSVAFFQLLLDLLKLRSHGAIVNDRAYARDDAADQLRVGLELKLHLLARHTLRACDSTMPALPAREVEPL